MGPGPDGSPEQVPLALSVMIALAQGNKHLIKITNKGGVIHFDEKSERKVLLDYLNYLEKEGGNKFTNSEDMVDIYLKIKK